MDELGQTLIYFAKYSILGYGTEKKKFERYVWISVILQVASVMEVIIVIVFVVIIIIITAALFQIYKIKR